MNNTCRSVFGFYLALLSLTLTAAAADESANPDTEIWRKVRADLFGERPITQVHADGRIALEMPARAADAAVVPLVIRVRPSPNDAPTRKLYVVIDRNPSPIAGIFEFGKGSGSPELETRVRIEEYTWVRVIAEWPTDRCWLRNATSRRPAVARHLPASHWPSAWPGWGR